MQQEIWKPVLEYEQLYEVSNLGNVRSCDRVVFRSDGKKRTLLSKMLNPEESNAGYLRVALSKNSKKIKYSVHRLVAFAFLTNHENLPQINHDDGNKKNNCASNLMWSSRSDNEKHAHRTGLKIAQRGSEHIRARKIYMLDFNGKKIREFGSVMDAHRETGINRANISNSANGYGRVKSAGGYKWKFDQTGTL